MSDKSETTEQLVARLLREEISLTAYDPAWPVRFREEKEHLLSRLPTGLIVRIEHFGSTAVPGLAAKPIVDMLIEVTDLGKARLQFPPILEPEGYDYLWRPTKGDDGPPFYVWFIKRDPATGSRTHHIHVVGGDFDEHWERLLFRDYLIDHPEVAAEYGRLKHELAAATPRDREAYTDGKTKFVTAVTAKAKRHYARD